MKKLLVGILIVILALGVLCVLLYIFAKPA